MCLKMHPSYSYCSPKIAGSGAKVPEYMFAGHIPVVTVQTCAWGYVETSSYKRIQPVVAVRGSGHGDRSALPRFNSDALPVRAV